MRKEVAIIIAVLVVLGICATSAIILTNNSNNVKSNDSNITVNNTTNDTTENGTNGSNNQSNTSDPENQKENYMASQPTKWVDGVQYKLIYDDNGNPSYWVSMDLNQKQLPLEKNTKKSSPSNTKKRQVNDNPVMEDYVVASAGNEESTSHDSS